MSIRHQQHVAAVRRAVATILERGLQDPRYRGLVTITEVDLSPDRRQATVHVSVIPEQHGPLTMAALASAAGMIQRRLRDALNTRVSPRVRFELDDRLKREAAVYEAIRQGLEREAPVGEEAAAPDQAPPAEDADAVDEQAVRDEAADHEGDADDDDDDRDRAEPDADEDTNDTDDADDPTTRQTP